MPWEKVVRRSNDVARPAPRPIQTYLVPVVAGAAVAAVDGGMNTVDVLTCTAALACATSHGIPAGLVLGWLGIYVLCVPYWPDAIGSRSVLHTGISMPMLAAGLWRIARRPSLDPPLRPLQILGFGAALWIAVLRAYPLGASVSWAAVYIVRLYPCRFRISRLRTVLPNAALIVLSSVLAVLAADLFARFALGWHSPGGNMYRPHSRVFFEHNPGGVGEYLVGMHPPPHLRVPVALTSQGLREDRLYGAKAADEFRILLLGDSFTVGYGVGLDDTIGRYLERALNAGGVSPRVTVVNGGTAGYAPWQSFVSLDENLLAFEPDLVIHQLFLTNDIDGMLDREEIALESFDGTRALDVWQQEQWQNPVMRFDRFLQQHSALYAQWLRITDGRRRVATCLRQTRFFPPVQPPSTNSRSRRKPYIEHLLMPHYEELETAWELLYASLDDCRALCQSQDIAYAVYSIPDLSQLYDPRWETYLEMALPGDHYERWNDRVLLAGYCADRGIPFIDVGAALQGASDPLQLYYEHDGHLTAVGCEVVGGALAAWYGAER